MKRKWSAVEVCDVTGELHVPDGGNLRYPVQEEYLSKARAIVNKVQSGTSLAVALIEAGEVRKSPAVQQNKQSPRTLVILYTDFEPDDVLAVAQILEFKRQLGRLEYEPLVIFCANFVDKDHGTVYEKKMLMASLMLGITDFPVLTCEGDKGDVKPRDGPIHPKSKEVADCRCATLASICESISSFDGDNIDFYIMAPGRGNLGAIVKQLETSGAWPLRAKWRVSMYSGSFNTRGMHDADLEALEVILGHSDTPLVDLSKFPFFGGKACHPVTASLATFSAPTFAAELTAKAPLLVAAMVLFNEEFNQALVHPDNTSLFRGSVLSVSEEQRFADIKNVFFEKGVIEYARALKADAEIWHKVVDYKRSTVASFAAGACDSPLCDQLLFLYEWLKREKPGWLANEEIGQWCLNRKSGFTSIDRAATDGIRAIQPVLRNANDTAILEEIRGVLQTFALQHVEALRAEPSRRSKVACRL